jgi:uncharacterized membrane protein
MNFKKTVLYLLIGIFFVVFLYNFILPYMFVPNYSEMESHMGGMSHNYSIYSFYSNLITFIIFIFITAVILVILFKSFTNYKSNQCKKCGLPIESEDWLICPRCGNHLKNGSVKEK